jgi:hypothetical protein
MERRDVGDIGNPELVGGASGERALDQIGAGPTCGSRCVVLTTLSYRRSVTQASRSHTEAPHEPRVEGRTAAAFVRSSVDHDSLPGL